MKKPTLLLAAVSIAVAGLVSCKKDDTSITIISAVAGNFVGKEICPPTPAGSNYTVDVYNQANATNGKVFIHNIYDIGGTYEATVSGNTITLPTSPYTYTSGSTTYKGNISGSGTLNGSVLTFKYKLDGPLADECTFVGTRDYRNPTEGNGG